MEGLPEGHGNGILQLRATHLEHVGELLALAVECLDEGHEVLPQFEVRGVESQMDGRRIGVVGRLRAVDVVVGRAVLIFTAVVTHNLQRTVGNHLVGVHVRRRAGAALNHVHGEELVELARADFAAGLGNGFEELVGEQPHLVVGHGGAQLHDGQPLDETGIVAQVELADGEVLQSAHGLHAVEHIFGDLHASEQVALGAGLLFVGFHGNGFYGFCLDSFRIGINFFRKIIIFSCCPPFF